MEKSTIASAPPQGPPQYGTPPPQGSPPHNPQGNPQYNPQFNPQYNPQFNPQFSPQFSPPGQPPTAYPPQVVYPQTVQPNPGVVMVQVPGGNPGAICAEHGHIPVTTYGALGIFLAIFCFPLGIIALLMDKRTTCNRCGAILAGGM